jgi:hypothetical protein
MLGTGPTEASSCALDVMREMNKNSQSEPVLVGSSPGRSGTRINVRQWALILVLATFLVGGCDMEVGKSVVPEFQADLDKWQGWSHDERTVAFHRGVASSYGPPGIYLVASSGGPSRFVRPGDLFWPEYLSFSNDDRTLFFEDQFRLKALNLVTGQEVDLTPPSGLVTSLSASPAAPQVVYALENAPSLGFLRVHDLVSGLSTAIMHDGVPVSGSKPQWSPSGDQIAVYAGPYRSYVLLMSPDGAQLDTLANLGSRASVDVMRWRRSGNGEQLLLVRFTGSLNGTYAFRSDGTWLGRSDIELSYYGAFSPRGDYVVVNDIENSGYGVLFIASVHDALHIRARQLTTP